MIKFNFSFKTICLTLLGVCFLGISNAYAATVATVKAPAGYYHEFDNFTSAWNDAQVRDGAELTLKDDCGIGKVTYNGSSTNFTLNLNGKTLYYNGNGHPLIEVNKSGGQLTITDGLGGGIIKNEGYAGQRVIDVLDGTLIVEGGTISAKKADPATGNTFTIRLNGASAVATIKGGTIIANGCGSVAPVIIDSNGGTVNVQGGTLYATGTDVTGWAFGIRGHAGTINISGNPTIYSSATPTSKSWAISNGATMNIDGGKFYSNGSLIHKAPTTLRGGYFKGNPGTASSGYSTVGVESDDVLSTEGYTYRVIPSAGCEAKVSANNATKYTYFNLFADAFAYAKTLATSKIVLVKNTISYSGPTLRFETAANCTLDLNGKSFNGNATSDAQNMLLIVNKSGATFTISDSGSGGKFTHEKAYGGMLYNAVVWSGTLNIAGGTVTAKNTTDNQDTRTVASTGSGSCTLNIIGGTITADAKRIANTVFAQNNVNTTISGGTLEASGIVGQVVYIDKDAKVTISGSPSITATSTTTNYARAVCAVTATSQAVISGGIFSVTSGGLYNAVCLWGDVSGASISVSGGKFKTPGNRLFQMPSVSSLSITGGYFNEYSGTTLKDQIANHVSGANKHVVSTTPAEKSSLGEEYVYKVATAYNLAWTLNGGTQTVAGTPAGYVGAGDPITAPTLTKTGYNYTWSPSVPATMPSANATYAANWTEKTYAITFYNGGGTVAVGGANVANGATTNVNHFTTKTLVATAPTGHHFVNWTIGGANAASVTLGSTTAASTTITATATNATVTANFAPDTYTVTVERNNNSYGTVSPSSVASVPYGSSILVNGNKFTVNGTTVTATPAATTDQYSFAFSSWSNASGTVTEARTITANFTATPRTYSVTLNTNGGTINAGNVPSYTYGTGAILPTNVTKDGYEFAGWYDNSGLAGSAVTAISSSETGNKEYWAKWTAATITFTGATNSLWSTTTNWSSGVLPTAEHDVIIQKPCSVNVQNAKAKSIAIYNNGSDKTGQLIIGPNQALEVTGAITKTTNGSNRIATTPSDLILQSAAAGNASLVFDNTDNTKYTQATVETYSKATYPVGGTATWQYIGVPFAGGIDAISNYYETWLYEWAYNGEKWTWMAKSPGDIVNPWYGYCITQRTAGNVSPQGTLCPTATIDLNFESSVGAGQNMVFANSWTAPIQITQMTVSDFVNVDPTIYFFNTGLDEHGTGGSGTAPGTYRTVPIASAASIGVTKISSAQGFYVKSSNTNAKVQLSYTKHVRPNGGNSIINGPMYAPKRRQAENPDVMKIVAQGSRYGTDLYLLSREDFSMGYDAGWDGENINGTGAGPLMYTLREDGTKDAISAVPEYEGTVVGFHAGEDSEYTFSFTYNGDEVWYLNDLLTETSTLISAEATYTFATTDDDAVRFVISATPLAKTPQGIESIQDSEVSVQKELINDQLYIKVGTRTYDATGKLVEK